MSRALLGWRWHALRMVHWDVLELRSHRVGMVVLRPYFVELDRPPLPDDDKDWTLDNLPPFPFPTGGRS